MSRIHFFSLLLALALVGVAQADGPGTLLLWSTGSETGGPPGFDEPLSSDRPDFTEASTTVGQGVYQLEFGYTYTNNDDGPSALDAHSFPETLLRVGVFADWLEARVAWNYGSQTESFGPLSQSASGGEDLYLGFKIGLTPQDGILPEMAVMPQMTVPTGVDAFTAGKVMPGFSWLYGWDINDWLSTAGSTQANLAVDDGSGDEFVEFAQSWTIGYTLTEKWGAYTEWYVLAPAGAETVATQHYLNAGFTYRVTNNFQLDWRVGKGISAAADDYFAGTGAVLRW
jgi:hypothetical protein